MHLRVFDQSLHDFLRNEPDFFNGFANRVREAQILVLRTGESDWQVISLI